MKDKELRRIIGGRAKQRRLELGVNQPYVAEKMGVTASTIRRYEAGTIDNTKKLVLDGLADALHVSVEWLKGEAEEYGLFVDSFRLACRKFKGNKESAKLAKTMGFESGREYDEIMFLREITHTVP